MSQDVINDVLHIAWGMWIAYCFYAFPLWLAPVMAILPREMEQTYHSIINHGHTFIEHIAQRGYWAGKLRDLAGFLIGGLALHFWIN